MFWALSRLPASSYLRQRRRHIEFFLPTSFPPTYIYIYIPISGHDPDLPVPPFSHPVHRVWRNTYHSTGDVLTCEVRPACWPGKATGDITFSPAAAPPPHTQTQHRPTASNVRVVVILKFFHPTSRAIVSFIRAATAHERKCPGSAPCSGLAGGDSLRASHEPKGRLDERTHAKV